MKKLWTVLAVLSLATVPALAQAPPSPEADLQETEAADVRSTPADEPPAEGPAEPLAESPTEPLAMTYPHCASLDGTACTTPGDRTFCQWTEYEPDICRCESNYLWNCIGVQ